LAQVTGTRTLTYGDLKVQSDFLAAHLSGRLADDRSPIAVIGHKEPEMLIAFLGCVKAGHPYVPLDISLPRQRIDDITAASGAGLTLTPEDVRKALSGPAGRLGNRPLAPSDPYYIIFTSGSTGVPKGVPITLDCLADFLDWMEEEQRFPEGETFLNQVPYSFDVSVMDTYLSLVSGGTVFSINKDPSPIPSDCIRLCRVRRGWWVSTRRLFTCASPSAASIRPCCRDSGDSFSLERRWLRPWWLSFSIGFLKPLSGTCTARQKRPS
jgi:D-alanine--poly(phosphoribitol) ligase subunit 1